MIPQVEAIERGRAQTGVVATQQRGSRTVNKSAESQLVELFWKDRPKEVKVLYTKTDISGETAPE